MKMIKYTIINCLHIIYYQIMYMHVMLEILHTFVMSIIRIY